MLDFALKLDAPGSIRYPKATAETVERPGAPIELGRAEVLQWGEDGNFLVFGSLVPACVEAARLLSRDGLDVGVINARFLRPLDVETITRAIETNGFLITVEESTLQGGFGSAVLEAANDHGLKTQHIRRLGIPDRFIEHGEREELLADLGLDVAGLMTHAREMSAVHHNGRSPMLM